MRCCCYYVRLSLLFLSVVKAICYIYRHHFYYYSAICRPGRGGCCANPGFLAVRERRSFLQSSHVRHFRCCLALIFQAEFPPSLLHCHSSTLWITSWRCRCCSASLKVVDSLFIHQPLFFSLFFFFKYHILLCQKYQQVFALQSMIKKTASLKSHIMAHVIAIIWVIIEMSKLKVTG